MSANPPIMIRAVTPQELQAKNYFDGAIMLPLRLHDTKPSQTPMRGLEILLAFNTVYFAKSDQDATEVRGLMVRINEDTPFQLGYNGQAELVLDSVGHYLRASMIDESVEPALQKIYPYLATVHLRVRLNKALWDITSYHTIFPDRELKNPTHSIDQTFDHDNRFWRVPTINSMVAPCKLEVRRIDNEDQPAEILMENFPDVDGKPAVQHLCLFDNLPVMPDVPEQDAEQHEQRTGIVDPRTGRPFEMN